MSELWSNTWIGEQRLTWRQLAEQQDEELRRLRRLEQILNDLDRCQHGRHEGDACSGCYPWSTGNPIARVAAWEKSYDRQIGFSMDAKAIVVPRTDKHDPDAWIPGRRT